MTYDAVSEMFGIHGKRIEAVEHLIEHAQEGIEKCFERVEDLEAITSLANYKEFIKDFNCRIENLENYHDERITELERFQEITHLQYQKVVTGKVPHKCPVCQGLCEAINEDMPAGAWLGKYHRQDASGTYDVCKACEGKGVLWK